MGCGFAAREIHVPRLRELREQFDVTATCDIDSAAAERVAGELGTDRVFTDAAELIEEGDVEAVAVMTPLHASPVGRALDSGLHVFVEKPLAEDPSVARQLAHTAMERERCLLVGTMRTYDSILPVARSALARLGPLLWVELRDACSGALATAATGAGLAEPMLQSALPEGCGERHRNALQTALLEMVHDVSILRALFGDGMTCPDAWASDDGWTLCGRLELPGGVPCLFGVAEFGRVGVELFEVVVTATGENGTLRLTFADPNRPGAPTRMDATGSAPLERATDTYLEEWRHFHECITSGLPGNGAAGADDVRLLHEVVAKAVPTPRGANDRDA